MQNHRLAVSCVLTAAMAAFLPLAPPAALALAPAEVLVVANANVEGAVELAQTYVQLRSIPDSNLLLVKTAGSYKVSRDDYDQQIAGPIRDHLREKKLEDRVQSIVLMWGVPVRVMAPRDITRASAVSAKAKARLQMDHKLLSLVGKSFPKPRTTGLQPIADLFPENVPPPNQPYLKDAELLKEIDRLVAAKEVEVKKISDEANRRLATRQLMAVHLDVYGLAGLIRYLDRERLVSDEALGDLKKNLFATEARLEKIPSTVRDPKQWRQRVDLQQETGGWALVWSYMRKTADAIAKRPADAAVDSELAALWWKDMQYVGWERNPLHWRVAALVGDRAPRTLMTSRIDGPTKADALRIIKDSIATEQKGLKGTFYIDAGGKHPQYDKHLTLLAEGVRRFSKMPLVLDTKPTVFPKDSCPDAALYVGWYSLRRYVPAFTWAQGAVGWHIASFEAENLRDPDSNEWCVKMIQNGVAATIGPVAEPYLSAFPAPEEFFPLLMTGKYTLAECYWRTNPMVSWRMTLIGDPLYSPFKANPQVPLANLPRGLAP